MRRVDAATKWSLSLWFVFALVPLLISCMPWSSWYHDADLPPWVQAIGSIAAVLATGGAILLQHSLTTRHAEAQGADDRRRRLEGARRLVLAGVKTLEKCLKMIEQHAGPMGIDQTQLLLRIRELCVVADTLRTVNAVEMDDWMQTEAIATTVMIADAAAEFLKRQVNPRAPAAFAEIGELPGLFDEMRRELVQREATLARALGYSSARGT